MNTDLMTKLQTLIYSNQDKLEQLVEALESVCKESNTTVAPEAKHPLEDYTISEKDIGALVFIDGKVSPKPVTHFMLDDKYVFNNREGIWYKDDFKPYTDSIKLHFKPHYATEGSSAPSELVEGRWVAVLFENGTIDITEDYTDFFWAASGHSCNIIGYQILSFVNPILEK
jgi:hypothetical protein